MRQATPPPRRASSRTSPLARRGHRTEQQVVDEAADSPFARVNQDCVDIIVEYAACSVDAVLQLRRVSRGVATGVVNRFAVVFRRARWGYDYSGAFVGWEKVWSPLKVSFDLLPPEHGTARGRHAFLVALYNNAPLETEYDGFWFQGRFLWGDRSALTLALLIPVSDTLVRSLVSRYPRITELDCGDIHALGDAALLAVADKCTALRSLRLLLRPGKSSATALLAILAKCPSMNRVGLFGPSEWSWESTRRSTQLLTSPATLQAIGEHCPQLTALEVFSSVGPEVSLRIMRHLARRFANLSKLTMSVKGGRYIDDIAIAFAENCPHLTDVSVPLTDVTDVAVAAIAHNCRNLQLLDASYCSRVTAAGVGAIARHCPHVTSLDLYTRACTSDSLAQLSDGCRLLRCFRAGGCEAGAIDEDAIAVLVRGCAKLSVLQLDLEIISGDQLAALRSCSPVVP